MDDHRWRHRLGRNVLAGGAGLQEPDLDGSENAAPGGVSQTFDTKVNSTYVVTYSMSGNPDSGPADKTMTVGLAGTNHLETYNTATSGTTRTDMKWVTKTYTFVAQQHPDHPELHQHD